MLWCFSEMLTFRSLTVQVLTIPLACCEWEDCQFKALCFGVSLAFKVSKRAHQRSMHHLHYLNDLLVIADSASSAGALLPPFPVLSRLWDCINMEKWDLKPTQRALYHGMLMVTNQEMGTNHERVCPLDSQIIIFQGIVTEFLSLSELLVKLWQRGHVMTSGSVSPLCWHVWGCGPTKSVMCVPHC